MKSPFPKSERRSFQSFNYPIASKRSLAAAETPNSQDFLSVIFQRRSSKISKPAPENKLGLLLHYATKIHSTVIDGYGNELSRRTTPSAGAIHPVDVLYSLPTFTHERHFEYFNPHDNSLNDLELDHNTLTDFFDHVGSSVDISKACIIWFAIQPNKTASKYENPESLYWRDAGAMLYCFQLFATYLGLLTVPVGSLATEQFGKLFSEKLLSGGGILIGI